VPTFAGRRRKPASPNRPAKPSKPHKPVLSCSTRVSTGLVTDGEGEGAVWANVDDATGSSSKLDASILVPTHVENFVFVMRHLSQRADALDKRGKIGRAVIKKHTTATQILEISRGK
jgi:hypothetical protein